MARRGLASAGQTPSYSRAGALRKGRSYCADLAVGRSFFAVGLVVGLGLCGCGGLALAGLEFMHGKRLGCEGMYYMVKDLAKGAGLENFYRHRGRHTFASRMIEDGMDAYLAMQLTHHRSVQAQSLMELLEEGVMGKGANITGVAEGLGFESCRDENSDLKRNWWFQNKTR